MPMDALEICGGYLVQSLVWSDTWFWFGPGGIEIEIRISRTVTGTREVFLNKHVDLKTKESLTKAVMDDGRFRLLTLQKEERQVLSDSGSGKHRVA